MSGIGALRNSRGQRALQSPRLPVRNPTGGSADTRRRFTLQPSAFPSSVSDAIWSQAGTEARILPRAPTPGDFVRRPVPQVIARQAYPERIGTSSKTAIPARGSGSEARPGLER